MKNVQEKADETEEGHFKEIPHENSRQLFIYG